MSDMNAVPTTVTDLEIGMFVSALDRPWSETPFLVEGFYITSQDDIDELESHCKFVYVDVYRSRIGNVRRTSRLLNKAGTALGEGVALVQPRVQQVKFRQRNENIGATLFPHRKLRKYEDACSMHDEMPAARAAMDTLGRALKAMSERYAADGVLEATGVRDAANPVVDSVLRNPDACVWLARIREEGAYASAHALGACIWVVALGRQLGLPKIDLQKMAVGALLFDIGKLRVPRELLTRRERLSRDEFQLVKAHVQFGIEMLKDSGVFNRTVADMVENHHERWGGHGYPRGLSATDIPVFGRIAAIVDCYDAITSRRNYSTPMSPSHAVKKLYAWRDIDFDADLVEEFIQAIGIYPAGTLVELSSGEVGIVMGEYRVRRLRPQLLMVLDRDKQPLREFRPLDLSKSTHDEAGHALEISTSLEPGAFGVNPDQIAI